MHHEETESLAVLPATSPDLDAAEVSWFAALCSDDYQFTGQPDGALRPPWYHCGGIVKKAAGHGFRNILCPSSYQMGQDTLTLVAGGAPITDRINFLAAIRCGEMQPLMLARTVAMLDHMPKGRLTLNVISSDFPGAVGLGAVLVGSTDQTLSEITVHRKMGIRAFNFSCNPHMDEANHVGTKVLPHLKTCSLPHAYARVPAEIPATPLGNGVRY